MDLEKRMKSHQFSKKCLEIREISSKLEEKVREILEILLKKRIKFTRK